MHTFFGAVSGKMELILFVYALSFTAMGLLLFVQPRKESSFPLSGHLPLLGWFGLTHGAHEFLDLWTLMAGRTAPGLDLVKALTLTASYLLLLEFGRRALRDLLKERGDAAAARLLGPAVGPVFAAALALAAWAYGDTSPEAAELSRPLLCLPGSLMAGLAFLGYRKVHTRTVSKVGAGSFFAAAGAALLAYAALGGLIVPEAQQAAGTLTYSGFAALFGLPVQLFRAVCAAVIFGAVVGVVRIFRESALVAARQELLDIIEFFPDATFVIDDERKVIAWNLALERLTGVSKRDMLGKGDFAYSVPFYGARRPVLIDLIGEPHPEAEKLYSHVSKRPDGSISAEVFLPSLNSGRGAHVWVTASPLRDTDGNVYGAIESVRDISDKKRSEEALQQSETRYRALIETTNTGFLITDESGRVQDANQEYVRLTGRASLDEILGRRVLEWTAPYQLKKNEAALAGCLRDGHIRNFEVDYMGPDGSVLPVELNATVVEVEGKRRVLTLCRDISERRLAENRLRESEDKFRSLTERSLVGVYLIQDGVFKYVNPKMAQIFGYPEEEMLAGMKPQDTVHPDDWPLVRSMLARRVSGEISDINYTFRGVRKDGRVIDLEVFGARSEFSGRPAILGTLLDVTDRKRTQDALRESEERYRSLVDNAPIGIVVHSSGVMRFINRKMADLVGVADTEEAVGRNVMEFLHPDFREFARERMARSLADGAPLPPAEEKVLTESGSVLDVEISTVPITYRGERCSMAIVQDITARKKAERELLAAKADLEKRVEERTAQLAELNSELEAFSYSAAHDLKAPLRRIGVFAEMLEKEPGGPLDANRLGYLASIRKSVLQMTDLVQSLLNLATLGKQQLRKERVDLAALLGEVVAEAGAAQGAERVSWALAPLPEADCDRAMVRQVLANLVSNAVKYSRNSPSPRVEVTYELKDGQHVFGVRDNGVGFDMAQADKLFGVFQRLHRQDEFEGSGIGLSIVRRIITRHGGRVWAESSSGGGAAFHFTLPA